MKPSCPFVKDLTGAEVKSLIETACGDDELREAMFRTAAVKGKYNSRLQNMTTLNLGVYVLGGDQPNATIDCFSGTRAYALYRDSAGEAVLFNCVLVDAKKAGANLENASNWSVIQLAQLAMCRSIGCFTGPWTYEQMLLFAQVKFKACGHEDLKCPKCGKTVKTFVGWSEGQIHSFTFEGEGCPKHNTGIIDHLDCLWEVIEDETEMEHPLKLLGDREDFRPLSHPADFGLEDRTPLQAYPKLVALTDRYFWEKMYTLAKTKREPEEISCFSIVAMAHFLCLIPKPKKFKAAYWIPHAAFLYAQSHLKPHCVLCWKSLGHGGIGNFDRWTFAEINDFCFPPKPGRSICQNCGIGLGVRMIPLCLMSLLSGSNVGFALLSRIHTLHSLFWPVFRRNRRILRSMSVVGWILLFMATFWEIRQPDCTGCPLPITRIFSGTNLAFPKVQR